MQNSNLGAFRLRLGSGDGVWLASTSLGCGVGRAGGAAYDQFAIEDDTAGRRSLVADLGHQGVDRLGNHVVDVLADGGEVIGGPSVPAARRRSRRPRRLPERAGQARSAARPSPRRPCGRCRRIRRPAGGCTAEHAPRGFLRILVAEIADLAQCRGCVGHVQALRENQARGRAGSRRLRNRQYSRIAGGPAIPDVRRACRPPARLSDVTADSRWSSCSRLNSTIGTPDAWQRAASSDDMLAEANTMPST